LRRNLPRRAKERRRIISRRNSFKSCNCTNLNLEMLKRVVTMFSCACNYEYEYAYDFDCDDCKFYYYIIAVVMCDWFFDWVEIAFYSTRSNTDTCENNTKPKAQKGMCNSNK
jgi:hypothetical protein